MHTSAETSASVTNAAVTSGLRARWRRWVFAAASSTALVAVVLALIAQHVFALDPCPLCILQRYAFIGIALFAALALMRNTLSILAALLAVGSAGAGIAIAMNQVFMVNNPMLSQCKYSTFRLVNEALPAQWFPALFAGTGDCLAADWSVAGFTFPHLSLLLLTLLFITCWLGLILPRRDKAAH